MKTNGSKKAIIILFLLLVFGFTAASIVAPKRTFSENENRLLAQMPSFSSEALWSGNLTSGYETYITDQFFIRDEWIRLKTMSEIVLNKQDINGIYLAKDGYLIERHEASEVDQEVCDRNVDRLVSFATKYAELLGSDHVKVMLVPTASEVLTDKLPPFATGFDQQGMLDSMYSRLPDGVGLDIRDVLTSHSQESIYYKTDHHWTTLGAYYAYQAWANASGFNATSLEDITQVPVTDEFLGTIHSKLNLNISKDTMYRFDWANASKLSINYDMAKDSYDTMYVESHLSTKDKYSYYLDGNHALVEIDNLSFEADGTDRKLLIIKDSYAHCFTPFTTEHYETVYMVDFRYFNMPISAFIDQYGITDILVLYNGITFATDTHSGAFIR